MLEPVDWLRDDMKIKKHPVDAAGLRRKHQTGKHTDRNRCDDVGKIKDGSKEMFSPYKLLVKYNRQDKGDDQFRDDRNDPDDKRVEDRLEKIRVIQQSSVVAEPDKHGFSKPAPLLKAHVQRVQNRVKTENQKHNEIRRDEKVPVPRSLFLQRLLPSPQEHSDNSIHL